MKLKQFKKVALPGAIALLGMTSFSACSSDENVANTNPTFDGKSVKTQFAINIPRAASQTRMTAVNTQNNNNNFLGMEDVLLIPFPDNAENVGASSAITSKINLSDIPGNELSESQSSKIYSDVSVPTGTKSFLFYAVAPYGAESSTYDEKFTKGTLNFTSGNNVSDISANLRAIMPTNVYGDDQFTKLLNVLNNVANAEYEDGKAWSSIAANDPKKLYDDFIKLKTGSAAGIKSALEKLYNAVENYKSSYPDLTSNIRTAITEKNVFTAQGTYPYQLKYSPDTKEWYPRNLGLPDGAVSIAFNNGAFNSNSSSSLIGLTGLDAKSLCYPASLYYYANTNIRTSNNEFNDWPKTTKDWSTGNKWEAVNWGGEVTSATRTIALIDNIQYGVASLELTVKCATAKLEDNPDANGSKAISVPTEGFPVTGVLIGGQPVKAGYKFEPQVANENEFNMTVYDRDVNIKAKYNAEGGTNYTLVLPNEFTTHQNVNIAIELENNTGMDFRGKDGIIPAGDHFYLVGTLDPNDPALTSKPVNDVFVKDYETTATLTITSLKNAYNTIPDLRSTKMQLGLSVDLTWTPGLQFDINLE